MPTLAITEQISRFGVARAGDDGAAGRDPGHPAAVLARPAAAASLARTAGAARRLGCLKLFVARLQRSGGYVVAGSDTSNPYVVPGASVHRELELLVEAGFPPREALAAATRTAAAFLGQARTVGPPRGPARQPISLCWAKFPRLIACHPPDRGCYP